jgi:hypothetical protein
LWQIVTFPCFPDAFFTLCCFPDAGMASIAAPITAMTIT